MKRKLKITLITTGIIVVLVVAAGITFMQVIKRKYKPTALNLDDAPKNILDIKDDLSAKLENDNFTWDDMPDFLIFSQYVAYNHPIILDLIKDWEETVWFNVTDEDDMWFIITGDSLTYEIGPNPPTNYGILIELDFATIIDIIKTDVTPQKAFQRGDLKFEGKFGDVLKVNQIVEIAAQTLSGTYAPPVEISDNFFITADNKSLYNTDGLTLIPYIRINLDPNQIGEPHVSTPSTGKLLILNNLGEIVAELEDSAHTVLKFINSTTVAMGGQEGFMELWNYKTNTLELLSVPGGHHELDYNPETDSFMILEYVYSNETWDGWNVIYDKISEYSREGDLIWEWDARIHYPFNITKHTSLGLNLTFRGGADWMHANSFVWDKEKQEIYLNIRNLDIITKIDYQTKDIVWEAGRLGNFTLLDEEGSEVDSIFHQPHSLERLDDNRFIIFDNDLYNMSNPDTMTLKDSQGYSRLLEFEIDQDGQTMRELWSWTITNETYYLPESGGDAERLPDGNTLGLFGDKSIVLNVRDPVIITEVTEEGEIAWELVIDGLNNTYFWVQRLQRFYEKPIIKINDLVMDLQLNQFELDFSTWNSYKSDFLTEGVIKIQVDKEIIYQREIDFLEHWQTNDFTVSLNNVSTSTKRIFLIVENEDGILAIEELYNISLLPIRTIILATVLPVSGIGIIVAMFLFAKKKDLFKKLRNKR